MKTETFEFICPTHYLSYIFNADVGVLTDEEIERIDTVLNGLYFFDVVDEPFFSYYNDFNNLGSDCITLIACK